MLFGVLYLKMARTPPPIIKKKVEKMQLDVEVSPPANIIKCIY